MGNSILISQNASIRPAVASSIEPQWRTHRVEVGADPLDLIKQEWLLANGTGAFSMGTAAGINTRRYHGLFIACERAPVGRVVALNQMLEQLTLNTAESDHVIDFSACLFRDVQGRKLCAPKGHVRLHRFERGLSVAWHYARGSLNFVRELHLHWKQQTATLRYLVSGLDHVAAATLRLSPMLTLRDFHALFGKDRAEPMAVEAQNATLTVCRAQTAVTLCCDHGQFVNQPDWWYELFYPIEAERGQPDTEDCFLPGYFEIDLDTNQPNAVTLTVTLGTKPADPRGWSSKAREQHLAAIGKNLGSDDRDAPLKRTLAIAADDFVVDRTVGQQKLSTILAGYPWFADWGRDTFIALPGLLLETGRLDEARATLEAFAQAMKNGLVPNRFDDYHDHAAHYNTADASLWFVHSAIQYLRYSGDQASWDQWLKGAAKQVVEAYLHGTDYNIKAAGDALVCTGSPQTQLTWMDASNEGVVFTSRHGKAVEINALWYNALAGLAEILIDTEKHTADHYEKLAGRARRAFMKVFWDEQLGYLRDHVWTDDSGQDQTDDSLRPNQIFAVSLPHSPLPRTKQQKVITCIKQKLLTPYGLLTLPADDPNYHGRYVGPPFDRDEAYHQGTVWPWLIGPYAEGVLRAGQFKPPAKAEARAVIAPLLDMLCGRGNFPALGQLYEIHEADAPHRPVGCMAQAWSVAEVLRVLRLIERDDTK